MVTFIDCTNGGYLSHIKIENESMLMMIHVEWWFPNTQKNVDALFKIMYANDFTYNIGNVLDKLIYRLDVMERNSRISFPKESAKLCKNIARLKMYNGLYGGSDQKEGAVNES